VRRRGRRLPRLDPEVIGGSDAAAPKPTSHMRSREEYAREVRDAMQRWLPEVPFPSDVRSVPPTSDVASNTSGSVSHPSDEWAEVQRRQDRRQKAPHSFRSRPPMHLQAAEGHSIGVGYIVLTLREIAGLSQRRLARCRHFPKRHRPCRVGEAYTLTPLTLPFRQRNRLPARPRVRSPRPRHVRPGLGPDRRSRARRHAHPRSGGRPPMFPGDPRASPMDGPAGTRGRYAASTSGGASADLR
jgi:hypothetical protein